MFKSCQFVLIIICLVSTKKQNKKHHPTTKKKKITIAQYKQDTTNYSIALEKFISVTGNILQTPAKELLL